MTPTDYARGLTTREQLLLRVIKEEFPGARGFTDWPDRDDVVDMREWGLVETFEAADGGCTYATITPLGREVCEMRRKMGEEARV